MTRRRARHCKIVGSTVICCSLPSVGSCHFTALADILHGSLSHPHIVDSEHYNVLMRLGNPAVYNLLGSPSVSLLELTATLREKAGLFYPAQSYDLVDVSLLGKPSEQDFVEIERRTFGKQLIHWPTHGVLLDNFQKSCSSRGLQCPDTMQPAHMSRETRFKLARDHQQWDGDQLEERVQTLHALLQERDAKPKVILFHDMDGCDRTGALHAAYALRFRNRSLTEAIAENELIARRHMSYRHQVAAQWYCEYLVSRGLYWRGYDCGNCAPYRCGESDEQWNMGHLCGLVAMLGTIAMLVAALWRAQTIPYCMGKARSLSCVTPPQERCYVRSSTGQGEPDTTPPPPRLLTTTPPVLRGIWRRRQTHEDYLLLSA